MHSALSTLFSDKAELVSVDADETILRNFDMETNFGPCVGNKTQCFVIIVVMNSRLNDCAIIYT